MHSASLKGQHRRLSPARVLQAGAQIAALRHSPIKCEISLNSLNAPESKRPLLHQPPHIPRFRSKRGYHVTPRWLMSIAECTGTGNDCARAVFSSSDALQVWSAATAEVSTPATAAATSAATVANRKLTGCRVAARCDTTLRRRRRRDGGAFHGPPFFCSRRADVSHGSQLKARYRLALLDY